MILSTSVNLPLSSCAKNGINHWPTPPESPDMNPVECIWAKIRHYIRKYVKPQKRDDLIAGINEYWQTVTVQHIYPPFIQSDAGRCKMWW